MNDFGLSGFFVAKFSDNLLFRLTIGDVYDIVVCSLQLIIQRFLLCFEAFFCPG